MTGDYGGVSDGELREFHRERMVILSEAKPDLLALESIPLLQEVKILLSLLSELSTPAWLTITLHDSNHLNSGESVKDFVFLIKNSAPK